MCSKAEEYKSSNYLFGIEGEIEKAVLRVKEAYGFAQRLKLGKLYVAFSGGKDSVALYGICRLAFGDETLDKCEFHYNVTGIDHPELVYFIREHFPFVQRDLYEKSMWTLIKEKKVPPTRLMRYCCAELKERGGNGRFCLTGVRWEESPRRRAKRGELELDGRILNADNSEDRRELEHCIPKQKYIVNPIVDWSEEIVWRFIIQEGLPYCSLYDKGFHRLGCIGCPMDSDRAEVLDSYPAFKAQYLRTFQKMIEIRRKEGLKCTWETAEEVMDWWLEK